MATPLEDAVQRNRQGLTIPTGRAVGQEISDLEFRQMTSGELSNNPLQEFGVIFIHDRNLVRVPLYFMPQEIQDSYSPVWNDQVIAGRSEPIRSYAHGGPRRVSCTLIFMAQGGSDLARTTPKQEVYDKVTTLRSALYPRYSAVIDTPPLVSLVVGGFLTIKGILAQAEVRWMGPWDVIGGMFPMRAELAVTIEQVNQKALGRADILAGR